MQRRPHSLLFEAAVSQPYKGGRAPSKANPAPGSPPSPAGRQRRARGRCPGPQQCSGPPWQGSKENFAAKTAQSPPKKVKKKKNRTPLFLLPIKQPRFSLFSASPKRKWTPSRSVANGCLSFHPKRGALSQSMPHHAVSGGGVQSQKLGWGDLMMIHNGAKCVKRS